MSAEPTLNLRFRPDAVVVDHRNQTLAEQQWVAFWACQPMAADL
jgi:hypothetical protein